MHRTDKTGHDNLPRCVKIRRLTFPVRSDLVTNPADGFVVQSDDCGHSSRPFRRRILHESAPNMDEPYCIRKRKHACGYERGVFSKAVSGGKSRVHGQSVFLLQNRQSGDACRHNGGLGQCGLLQFFVGALENDAPQSKSQRIIGLRKNSAGNGETLGKNLPHPDFLRPLPRENQSIHPATPPCFQRTATFWKKCRLHPKKASE